MFVDFLFALRQFGVKVSTHEWLALAEALSKGLHDSSLDGFYRLARCVCVKELSQFDAFDQAFLSYFKDVAFDATQITDDLLDWLRNPKQFPELTDEQKKVLQNLDLDALRKMFEERLKEQKERHDGGNRWIGTGGTSPFGHGGYHPGGLRIGGPGGGRSAMQVAEQRKYKDYRKDLVLDVRQLEVALRGLRELGRAGAEEELDMDETIDRTGRNAGDLEIVFRAPRRNRVKLILLMDVGGSMDPYAALVSRLFTAASRSGRFAKFRSYYFHNCIYENVYEDARFEQPISTEDLLAGASRDEKVVIVGDALMHPAELLHAGGAIYYYHNNPTAGIDWLRKINNHFRRAVWLNPEPKDYWPQTTIQAVQTVFPMWELTVSGMEQAVEYLVRGGKSSIHNSAA